MQQQIKLSEKDIVLSTSSIKDLQSCWRKYFFKHEQQLVPRRTSSPLQLGDAFHRGLQAYYSGVEPKDVLQQARELFEAHAEELPDDESFLEQCEYNSVVTRSMLIGYMMKYDAHEFVDLKPESEFCSCIYEAEDLRVFIVGKRDGLWKMPDGKWWLLENKTYGDNSFERYKTKLRTDIQNTLYIIATEYETGETIHGVFYNLAKKPLLKMREKESMKSFYERLKIDYIQRADEFYFKRIWIYRDEQDKEDLLNEIVDIARDLQRKKGDQTWYRNSQSCMQYSPCPYIPICFNHAGQDEIDLSFKKVKRFPELELTVLQGGEDGLS